MCLINTCMVIYKATNKINGKAYIGKTEKNLEIRKKQHLNDYKNSNFAFHRALQKYGEENFDWQILCDVQTIEELNQQEQYYIKLFETFGSNGYNMTDGGEGQSGWNPFESTRKLWSKQRKGKAPWNKGNRTQKQILSEEEKQQRQKEANKKRSKSLKGRDPWNKGKICNQTRTVYKVIYKDGTEKIGTRYDLELPKSTVDMMFYENCGSRKYNIKLIQRYNK